MMLMPFFEFSILEGTRGELQRVLRLELALTLYQRGMLAVGPSRRLVGI